MRMSTKEKQRRLMEVGRKGGLSRTIGAAKKRKMKTFKDKKGTEKAAVTKEDMMKQMKNVRDIPTTAGGVNSPRADVSQDDKIFENLMKSDGGLDELFG